jgi:hypothetical protein
VEYFFIKALPLPLHSSDHAAFHFKLLQAETLKWHPDKIPMVFGSSAHDEIDQNLFNTISRIVIKLRAEARQRIDAANYSAL